LKIYSEEVEGLLMDKEGHGNCQVDEDLLDNVKIQEELWLEKKIVQIHGAFLKFWQYFGERENCQEVERLRKKMRTKKFDRKLHMKK